ncbi:hypothetical protein [Streptomyces sp. R08]|uniref:Uncharacterized protein n=1 Tax=Streptomyces sp. R08 TaxID=3238624 RepID=A0AB39MIE3_9ACTN
MPSPSTGPVERVDELKLLEEKETRRQGLVSNLPAYAGAAIILLVIAKVAIVSHGLTATMLALISGANPLQVLSGAMILLLPFSGLIVIHANESQYKYRPGLAETRRAEIQLGVYLTLFLLSFVLSGGWILMTVVLLAVRHALFVYDKKRGKAVDRFTLLSHEEWLRTPPTDTICRTIWQAVNQKEEERRRVARRHPIDLASIERLDGELSDLSAQFDERAERINRLKFSEGAIFGPVVAIYAVTFLIQFFGNDRPWMPAERIELKNGDIEVGYIVESGDSWTTVLVDGSRVIVRLPSDSVKSRDLCAISKDDGSRTKTIYKYFSKSEPAYKPCPKMGSARTP